MADNILYSSAYVITTLKEVSGDLPGGNPYLVLDLPVKVFGQVIVREGKDITYSLEHAEEGQEVMAKIDYRIEVEETVRSLQGFMGDDPTEDPRYATHFPFTKEETLSTVIVDEGVVPYEGPDKNDPALFSPLG